MRIERGNLIVGSWEQAPIEIHWSVPLSAFVFGGFNWSPAFWLGFLVVVLVHEIGHAVAVRRVGGAVASIQVTGWGGHCEWYGEPTELEDALVAAGGILAQLALLLAVVLLMVAIGSPQQPNAQEFADALLGGNLRLALINLIPLAPLDGARAWRLLPLGWEMLRERDWQRRQPRSKPPAAPPLPSDQGIRLDEFLDRIPKGWMPPSSDDDRRS